MMLEGIARLLHWLRAKGDVLYPGSRATYSYIARTQERGSLLDVGCCFGAGTAFLAWSGFKTMGTDVDGVALQMARSLYPWLDWFLTDLSIEPFDDKFDIVIAIESLEHVKDQHAVMKNMLKAAKRKVIITTPNGGLGQSGNQLHEHEPTIDEMFALVAKNEGWRVGKILSVGDFRAVGPGTTASDLYYEIERVVK